MASPVRHLYVLRHAKSSWADPRLADHDRLLAPRGEKTVRRLRRHLTGLTNAPELVLCSSARRTTMTLDGIAASLPKDVETRIEDRLYAATSGELLARLRGVGSEFTSVMMIGHNPGLEDLAQQLIGAGEEAIRSRLAAKFPTGALAILSFRGAWAELTPGTATLDSFVVPREL